MKPAALWTAVLILVAAGIGCSGHGSSKAQPEPKRTLQEANDFGKDDSKRARLELSPPEPKLNVLRSNGDCAPKHENELAVASCFNNTPCRGQWARGESGQAECWCFAQKGGCDEGTICCAASRKCEKPEHCYVP